ncbi:MAG: formylglycine-generating enzyme family protein [Opitutales bacterium]|nr:formylglycine-generating enzyme family protein [Opitutales bacterium]
MKVKTLPFFFLSCATLGLAESASGALSGKLTLQHSEDGRTWTDVHVTAEMINEDGRLALTDLSNPSFFRLDVADFAPGSGPEGFSLIPAGTFSMGDHKNEPEPWMEPSRPVHEVYVSAFYMAKTPVTYAEWEMVRDWGIAHGYGFDKEGSRGYSGETWSGLPDTPENNQHPVTQVSWYDMVKWCNAKSEMEGLTPVYYLDDDHMQVYRRTRVILTNAQVNWDADGYRLPTEAEWEKAARGGLVGKRWPWGDADIDPARANYWNSSETNGTTPVASYPSNGYGLFDMAGNVWEWLWDAWSADWYSQPAASEPDTRGPCASEVGKYRVYRGGRWLQEPVYLQVAIRDVHEPSPRHAPFGFRIARRAAP